MKNLQRKRVWKYIQAADELSEEVKQKTLNVESFGIGHAEQLLRLKKRPEKQLELVDEFLKEPVSVRDFKRKVDEIVEPPVEQPKTLGFAGSTYNICCVSFPVFSVSLVSMVSMLLCRMHKSRQTAGI